MITPDISIDFDDAVRGLTRLEREQVPFAASKALNTLAKRGQAIVREELDPKRFAIAPSRRAFLERLVRIPRGGWATKTNLAVRLGVGEPSQSGKDRAAILSRHEEGGEARTLNPLKPFFIPTDEMRTGERDLVPRLWYPKALRLMESRGVVGQTVDQNSKKRKVFGTLGIQSRVTKRGVVQIQGKRRTFVMGSHDGRMRQAWGVWRRTGPGKADIEPIWFFRLRIDIKPRLGFGKTVRELVEREGPAEFERQLAEAVRTAK